MECFNFKLISFRLTKLKAGSFKSTTVLALILFSSCGISKFQQGSKDVVNLKRIKRATGGIEYIYRLTKEGFERFTTSERDSTMRSILFGLVLNDSIIYRPVFNRDDMPNCETVLNRRIGDIFNSKQSLRKETISWFNKSHFVRVDEKEINIPFDRTLILLYGINTPKHYHNFYKKAVTYTQLNKVNLIVLLIDYPQP